MECPRCANRDPTFFYRGSKGIYCRRCIRFRRILSEEEETKRREVRGEAAGFSLAYPLTALQEEAVRKCREYLGEGKDVLLHAVCGAGKTEMCVPLLAEYLKKGKRVGFAIARREVVIELAGRLGRMFPRAEVRAVYGGHSEKREGDIILCTTHQLYRFPGAFSFLVLDEVDAFPFKGDEVLWNIAHRACCGNILYSTATVDERMQALIDKGKVRVVTVNSRPHRKRIRCPLSAFILVF